jgi:hypothetical protein
MNAADGGKQGGQFLCPLFEQAERWEDRIFFDLCRYRSQLIEIVVDILVAAGVVLEEFLSQRQGLVANAVNILPGAAQVFVCGVMFVRARGDDLVQAGNPVCLEDVRDLGRVCRPWFAVRAFDVCQRFQQRRPRPLAVVIAAVLQNVARPVELVRKLGAAEDSRTD